MSNPTETVQPINTEDLLAERHLRYGTLSAMPKQLRKSKSFYQLFCVSGEKPLRQTRQKLST